MPFRLATPISTPQGNFPFGALTLVVSPQFTPAGVEAQIVLRAQPYDVVDGAVVRPMESVQVEAEDGSKQVVEVPSTAYDQDIVIGAGYAAARDNPALATVLTKVSAALQEYLLAGFEGAQ